MENIKKEGILDTAVPACYIERASTISGLNKVLITQWLCAINQPGTNLPRHYSQYIKIEAVEARNDHLLWTAIETSEHIWLNSTFEIQESAVLFLQVVQKAKIKCINHKHVFNFSDRREAMYNLSQLDTQVHLSIQRLEDTQSIRFHFWEDIISIMTNRTNAPGALPHRDST